MNKKILLTVLGILFYIIIGAIIPFLKQSKISDKYKKEFDISRFYNISNSDIYALPIRDNDTARIEKIRAINNSQDSIIIGTYRLLSDEAGKIYMASLLDAAKRGVDIKIIIDGNSLALNIFRNNYLKALDSYENVTIEIYNPMRLTRPWSLMGRMHDKYMIIDEKLVFLGGRNIENRFFISDDNENYDWDIVAYFDKRSDGDFVCQLENYFEDIYNNGERNKSLDKALIFGTDRNNEKIKRKLSNLYEIDKSNYFQNYFARDYKLDLVKVDNINLISNPINVYTKEPQAFFEITRIMKNAENRVNIHTPYLIANKEMYKEIKKISKNSDTTLFTNSPNNNANLIGVGDFILNKRKFKDLGINILLNSKENSYHGKAFLVDDNISAIGSFNWDMRSVYIDTELMAVVYGEEFNKKLEEEFNFYEDDATMVLKDGSFINNNKTYRRAGIFKKAFSIVLVIILYPFRFLF